MLDRTREQLAKASTLVLGGPRRQPSPCCAGGPHATAGGPDSFGPFGPAVYKPFSVTRRSTDGTSLLKTYRGVVPVPRRDREVHALHVARDWDLPTPVVRSCGAGDDSAWVVLSVVPGVPCAVEDPASVAAFVRQVAGLTALLHEVEPPAAAGEGWLPNAETDPGTASDYLLSPLSPRCHRELWWPDLRALLRPLDTEPFVFLHGDIKPEHLLVQGTQTHVVDWEACARGPAGCDFADAVFHAVRDLLYAGATPGRLPGTSLSDLPVTGPLLAWRVVRWLDRRRPSDMDALSLPALYRLAGAPTPASAVLELAHLVAVLRDHGVPR